MKAASFFLLLASLLPGVGVQGQETPTAGPAGEQVTRLIREALRSPDAPESWAGLAQGLTNLGSQSPAMGVELQAAIRVADSLAFSPLLGRVTQVERQETGGFLGALIVRGQEALTGLWNDPMAGLSLLGLVLGAWVLGTRVWRVVQLLLLGTWRHLGLREAWLGFSEVVQGVARVASGGAKPSSVRAPARKDPRTVALSLAESGVPSNEIARQTGLAQDELAVVMALSTRGRSFRPENLSPQRRSA